jgi:hypothetical protein
MDDSELERLGTLEYSADFVFYSRTLSHGLIVVSLILRFVSSILDESVQVLMNFLSAST